MSRTMTPGLPPADALARETIARAARGGDAREATDRPDAAPRGHQADGPGQPGRPERSARSDRRGERGERDRSERSDRSDRGSRGGAAARPRGREGGRERARQDAPSGGAGLFAKLGAWAGARRGAGSGTTMTAPAAALPSEGTGSSAMRAFEVAAEEVISRGRTRRAQGIVRTALVVVVLLVVWASFAQVDEVTKGEAKVISSKQLQTVQSLDGGVVSEILVKEGQVVEAGQVLLRIDETRATSGARENAAQGFALQARLARLRALADGAGFVPPTAATPDEQRIVDEERRLFEMRRTELTTQLQISQQQLAQRQQELGEMRARKVAAERGLDLAGQELGRTRPLLASGAVSEVDILKLERDVSRSRGESEQAAAQIARVQAAIGEAQRKLAETEISFRNEARKELAEAMGRLNALNQGALALNDKVDKSQIRSPVRGRVQRLLANTEGGVVTAGKDLVEIVPLDDKLVLEAKVQPRDIAFIHPGQQANVKFTAYDASIYGGLDAVVENISPDTVVDDRGNAFYLVRVQTIRNQLGERMPIIPGMTAEVDVLTGQKSVMSYLLKPVLKVKQNALRER